ncbi:MAG: hypothetical protein ACOX46_12120 [Limnochordia bacterium]|nr:hypothetical protein [Bacillota bacterium]NLL09223.1 hypothetical protein [Bacillota bacterium]HBG10338.1 hypothetical protein [Bacillota bacterium]
MFRRVRVGFSRFGFLVVVLQALPNVLWALFPPAQNVLSRNSSEIVVLEYGEHILGVSIVIMLLFLVSREQVEAALPKGIPAVLSLAAIALYWAGWACYYAGVQNDFIVYSLVVLPPLSFFCAGLAKRVAVISVTSLIFLVFHCAVTLENFPLW